MPVPGFACLPYITCSLVNALRWSREPLGNRQKNIPRCLVVNGNSLPMATCRFVTPTLLNYRKFFLYSRLVFLALCFEFSDRKTHYNMQDSGKHLHKQLITITKNTGWAEMFWSTLVPAKNSVVHHHLIHNFENGQLSKAEIATVLIRFFPIVKNFGRYMELNRRKVREHRDEEKLAGQWLDENILVEEKHAHYWILWAMSFGCNRSDFTASKMVPGIKALDDFLTNVAEDASLSEGLAGINLAIEWPTGEWVTAARNGMQKYFDDAIGSFRAMRWIKAHEVYDDAHPFEAMELIKMCATTARDKKMALRAAQRGLQHYKTALDHCLDF